MRPLPALALTPEETGVGLLVRRKGRPIGHILRKTETGATIPAEQLGEWICAALGEQIIAGAIREELAPPPAPGPVPSLTAAICTHARPKALARCLDSLRILRERHDFEILVVNNGPPLTAPEGARLVREPRPGLDFARNCALREATGDWVAFLDDDVTVDGGWYEGLREAWSQYPDAAAVTGLVLARELATEAQILFEQRGGFQRGFDTRCYRGLLPGNPLYPAGAGLFGAGCNMAFRRDILVALGGFDEALDTGSPLPGGGDLDAFFRIIAAGHSLVYEPACLVFHEHRRDLRALRHQYYTWGLGFMAYVGKHRARGSPHRPLFTALTHWWFRDILRQIRDARRGRHPLPARMLLAELAGGIVGRAGEYGRSRRRIAKIRASFP